MRRSWDDLGPVDTIYEGDDDEDSSSPASLSSASPSSLPGPSLSSPDSSLHPIVHSWSIAKGRKPDVLIHVQGSCFHLHKEPLCLKSRYLKRFLTEVSEATLSPPLNISLETFIIVASFCYGTDIVLTPFNVVALRTAAELLEMTAPDVHGAGSLCQITEAYFQRAVAHNHEYASMIFRSCISLLPEAEETASLASRCIEALSMVEGADAGAGIDDIASLSPEDFQVIADSMRFRLEGSHDLLYEIVDLYLKEQQPGKITEEQKVQICNSIECDKLSPQFLMRAVQSPRMPLRFVVRAMLLEQLNTRRSIFTAAGSGKPRRRVNQNDAVTLGAIMQRDAALRQVAQLKAAMEATSTRIQSLEKDLGGMKSLLQESETQRNELQSGRSASFRLNRTANKVERGERGSVSSVSHRLRAGNERVVGGGSCSGGGVSGRTERRLGRRVLDGLKSAFRLSSSKREDGKNKLGKLEEENVVVGGW